MQSQAYVEKERKYLLSNHTWRAFRHWPDVENFGFMFGSHLLCVKRNKTLGDRKSVV